MPPASEDAQQTQEIQLPWSPQPLSRKRDLLLPPDASRGTAKPMKAENRLRLLQVIQKGTAWLDEMADRPSSDTEALAPHEGCSERAVRMTLSLVFIAPDIVS